VPSRKTSSLPLNKTEVDEKHDRERNLPDTSMQIESWDVDAAIRSQVIDIALAAEDAGIKTFDKLVANSVKGAIEGVVNPPVGFDDWDENLVEAFRCIVDAVNRLREGRPFRNTGTSRPFSLNLDWDDWDDDVAALLAQVERAIEQLRAAMEDGEPLPSADFVFRFDESIIHDDLIVFVRRIQVVLNGLREGQSPGAIDSQLMLFDLSETQTQDGNWSAPPSKSASMDNRDNKRGFSGLSDLTSDTRAIPQTHPHQARPQPDDIVAVLLKRLEERGVIKPVDEQVETTSTKHAKTDELRAKHGLPQPSAPQKTVFALLKLNKWPTLPLPWSSVDSGETWVWGDFFLTFQKKPKTFEDFTMKMQGKKAEYGGMTYHYAMSVFYRIDRNPHGPSHRPIMIIALEQADMSTFTEMLGGMLGLKAGELLLAEGGDKMGPLVIGLFTGETRLNLGEYEGGTSSQAVKQSFFEILGPQLGVSGQPKMIGDLAQAYGHPETGLPAKKKNSGCAPVILLCIGIGGLAAWGLTFI
jgi:hypothetical protein